mgnify:CR=1 FL=1
MEITEVKEQADKICENISKVLIGREKEIRVILAALYAGGHVLVEDRPGTGKTLLAKTFAKSIGGQFTGLIDRNGKEIYEGDIVQLDYITTSGKHRIGLSFEVKWCTQEGCWVGWDGFVENTLQQTRKMFVVKGNIHDNPELLKGEAE